MLVEKWMTRTPVTIEESDSLSMAMHVLKEKKIRRLPVLRKGKLVGIVTDRDLKAASPSEATSLDIWELHFLLGKLKIKDVMSKKLITITPKDTIEKAAMVMMERRIGGLPASVSTATVRRSPLRSPPGLRSSHRHRPRLLPGRLFSRRLLSTVLLLLSVLPTVCLPGLRLAVLLGRLLWKWLLRRLGGSLRA